jgi:tetratricopeptide (TPR) repeat protein
MAMIQDMLKKNPEDSFLNYAVALEYRKNGNAVKAIEMMEHLLSFDENYLGAYYQLGKLYEEKDNMPKAISTYKRGKEVAKVQEDRKTLSELSEALLILDEDDGECW